MSRKSFDMERKGSQGRESVDSAIERLVSYVHGLPYFDRRRFIARRVRPTPSRFIYKYRSIDPNLEESVDRVRDILVRSRLWLSSPLDFNDPFDMSAKIVATSTGQERRERARALLKERGIRYKERERRVSDFARTPIAEIEAKLEEIHRKRLANTGVCSFAGDPRSILMWSHYSGNHTGLCVQFETARDFLTLSNAVPVEYSTEYPEINWITEPPSVLRKVILRKHEGWSYEKERRIIFPERSRVYLAFNPQAVVGVIVGCRASDENRKLIEQLIEERRHANLPDVRVYYSQKHSSQYQLRLFRH